MTGVVCDATVLIYLAKLRNLSLLEQYFADVFVPQEVIQEVVHAGQTKGYEDAHRIASAIDTFIVVLATEPDENWFDQPIQTLGVGEKHAIGIAIQRDLRLLSDDRAARKIADAFGVPVGGTLYVLLRDLEAGECTLREYINRLDSLDSMSFRMSASLYRSALRAGEEIAKNS